MEFWAYFLSLFEQHNIIKKWKWVWGWSWRWSGNYFDAKIAWKMFQRHPQNYQKRIQIEIFFFHTFSHSFKHFLDQIPSRISATSSFELIESYHTQNISNHSKISICLHKFKQFMQFVGYSTEFTFLWKKI